MAYSEIGVVNLSLGKIGQKKIASLTENSTAAIQAALAWPYIRDEVLSAADWGFAKTRVALPQNATAPVQGFDFAYTLPADFVRMCKDKKDDPVVYPNGAFSTSYIFGTLEIQGTKYNYSVETLADGTKCLFTDYNSSGGDLFIRYIRREENVARWSPLAISAASFRLGAELAPVLTTSSKKFESLLAAYEAILNSAKAHNAANDSVQDETGNDDWENAGR
jgi:hypothetical protein